jgi:hypothetical protein
MADNITNGDYISVLTNGWFEVLTNPLPPTVSGNYTSYSNTPNGYITKCTGTKYNNERELYDLFLTEAYNKHGVCLTYYIASYDTNYDKIFGEDNNRTFVRKFNFMAYFTLPREEKLFSKFGITGMDQFSMFTSKRHFQTASTYDYTGTSANAFPYYIPQQGDIIMSDYAKYVYEIVERKDGEGNASYLLSKQHLWELIVKPFKDEHISVPNDGTMTEMQKYANKTTDIFDNTQDDNTKKTNIIYQPKPGELPNNNPMANWG